MEIREVFARNLKAARRAKGLSQEELAHEAGIDRTYISSLELAYIMPASTWWTAWQLFWTLKRLIC